MNMQIENYNIEDRIFVQKVAEEIRSTKWRGHELEFRPLTELEKKVQDLVIDVFLSLDPEDETHEHLFGRLEEIGQELEEAGYFSDIFLEEEEDDTRQLFNQEYAFLGKVGKSVKKFWKKNKKALLVTAGAISVAVTLGATLPGVIAAGGAGLIAGNNLDKKPSEEKPNARPNNPALTIDPSSKPVTTPNPGPVNQPKSAPANPEAKNEYRPPHPIFNLDPNPFTIKKQEYPIAPQLVFYGPVTVSPREPHQINNQISSFNITKPLDPAFEAGKSSQFPHIVALPSKGKNEGQPVAPTGLGKAVASETKNNYDPLPPIVRNLDLAKLSLNKPEEPKDLQQWILAPKPLDSFNNLSDHPKSSDFTNTFYPQVKDQTHGLDSPQLSEKIGPTYSNPVTAALGYQPGAYSMIEFAQGIGHGFPRGLYDSAQGFSTLLRHPIDTVYQISTAMGHLFNLATSGEWQILGEVLIPEALDLVKEWESLSSFEKGNKGSYIVAKYGADIFIPGAMIKAASRSVKAVKELNAAYQVLQRTRTPLLAEGVIVPAAAAETIPTFQKALPIAEEIGIVRDVHQIKNGALLEKPFEKVIVVDSGVLSPKTFSIEELSKAGKVMDRGNLTKAGRSLDKHGGRPDSVFPKATGTPADKNLQGQYHLDEIINDPKKACVVDVENGGLKIYAQDGRGAYFRNDGTFRGFIERQYE